MQEYNFDSKENVPESLLEFLQLIFRLYSLDFKSDTEFEFNLNLIEFTPVEFIESFIPQIIGLLFVTHKINR